MIFIPSTLISDLPGEVEIQHDPFKNSRRISVSILLSWSEYFITEITGIHGATDV